MLRLVEAQEVIADREAFEVPILHHSSFSRDLANKAKFCPRSTGQANFVG